MIGYMHMYEYYYIKIAVIDMYCLCGNTHSYINKIHSHQ